MDSILYLKGSVFYSAPLNNSLKKFQLIFGELKLDTSYTKEGEKFISLKIIPFEFYRFKNTNKFEIKIKLFNNYNKLAITECEEYLNNFDTDKYHIGLSYAVFYNIGNLLEY